MILLRSDVSCAAIRANDSHSGLVAGCHAPTVQITAIVPQSSEFYQSSLSATPIVLTSVRATAAPKALHVPYPPRAPSSISNNDPHGQPTATGSNLTS